MEEQSKMIVRTYLILIGLYTLSASVIWGVNTLFLLDAGLSISEVFLVNAVFTGAMAFFEIPTGVLADTSGHRRSFLLSIAVLIVGTFGYVVAAQFSNNLLLFAFMSAILGLGYTFYSGAMEAWLVDALNYSGYQGELDTVFSKSGMITSGAMLLGSVLGGILGTQNLRYPYLLRICLLAGVLVVAFFTMRDLGFAPHKTSLTEMPEQMVLIGRSSIQYGWQQKSVKLIIIAGFIQALFIDWGFYAWQPYFLQLLGQDAPWVAGVIASLVSIAMIAGNWIAQNFSKSQGRRTTYMMLSSIIFSIAAIGVGLAGMFWIAVPLFLLTMMMRGVWMPIKQAYIHQIIPSEQRATVISFDSLVASGGSVIGQTFLGQLSERRSIALGYVVGGITTFLVLPVIWQLRRRRDAADFIVGQAGREGSCAAQGLPCVASVDSQAGIDIA